jgi:hypothetical protein
MCLANAGASVPCGAWLAWLSTSALVLFAVGLQLAQVFGDSKKSKRA